MDEEDFSFDVDSYVDDYDRYSDHDYDYDDDEDWLPEHEEDY